MLTYGAFFLGAACMLLGFFNVARGVGGGESATTFEMFGIKFSAQKLAPGLVFSVLGLVLVLAAVFLQPKFEPGRGVTSGAAAQQPGLANAPTSVQTPAAASETAVAPSQPAVRPAAPPEAAEARAPAEATSQVMTHEEVATLVRDTLTKISTGSCPQANLDAITFAQCGQAMPGLQQRLLIAGPIMSVSYFRTVPTAIGAIDQYVVIFQNGSTVWDTTTSGRRLTMLYAPPA